MKRRFFGLVILCCLLSLEGLSQWTDPIENMFSRIRLEERAPQDLLAKKSVLLFDPEITRDELNQIQKSFQQTGIDVVLYYPLDIPASNDDVNNVFVRALSARDIRFLIILRKRNASLEFLFTAFNKKSEWVDAGQEAWSVAGPGLTNLLESIHRVATAAEKKQNLLIIERPEMELSLNPVTGNRNEYFTLDLKVDRLAIIRSGIKETDEFLESYFKANYPFKYKFFDPGTEEKKVRGEGFLYVLKFMRCRSSASMNLLGYDLSNMGHRIKAVTYRSGKPEEVSLLTEQAVFKFYFKHLENGNIYLGTKWDGAQDWKEALDNYIQGFKAAAK